MSASSLAHAVPELPPSTVTVKNGKVYVVEQWTLWNLVPFITCLIERQEDGSFFASMGDPEHGGGFLQGTLQQVLVGLHPKIQEEYTKLFELENPDEEAIKRIGFRRHKLIG